MVGPTFYHTAFGLFRSCLFLTPPLNSGSRLMIRLRCDLPVLAKLVLLWTSVPSAGHRGGLVLPEFISNLSNLFIASWLGDRFAYSRHRLFCRTTQFIPALINSRLDLFPRILAHDRNIFEYLFRFVAFDAATPIDRGALLSHSLSATSILVFSLFDGRFHWTLV